MRYKLLPLALLASCASSGEAPEEAAAAPAAQETAASTVEPPAGATIEPSGFATVLIAPPEPYPEQPPAVPGEQETERVAREQGISVSDAESRMNPDNATRNAAMALRRRLEREAKGNYVDVKVIRDPKPRFVFYFRRDAEATLRRFTSDPRFRAVEGGAPEVELRPLMDQWIARLQPHRLVSGGSINAFEGAVELEIGVSRGEFETIAAREGWTVPPQVRFSFAPDVDESKAVAADAAPFIRTFARSDRAPGATLDIAIHGRIYLRDGCFYVEQHQGPPSLALFGRDTRLHRDREGYLTVASLRNPEVRGRIGEEMIWGGYTAGVEDEPGVRALRGHCGNAPIASVGAPTSARLFRIRPWAIRSYAEVKKLPLDKAWHEIRACWIEQDSLRERIRRGERLTMPMRECDSPFPINPPPPPRPK